MSFLGNLFGKKSEPEKRPADRLTSLAKLPPIKTVPGPAKLTEPANEKNMICAAGDGWAAYMGWRYITYVEGQKLLSFQIEPMVMGADVVYIPNTMAWSLAAPSWAGAGSSKILARLKSIAWKRELEWQESADASFLANDAPVSGSLESTSGGQQLEAKRLFHPDSSLTHAQAHEVWHVAERRFAEAARGRVTIFASGVNPKSVFGAVALPALRANPGVTLDFK